MRSDKIQDIAMTGLIYALYPWLKAFHILAVISWMAGLLYLPRLFHYHLSPLGGDGGKDQLFQTMERRLLRIIMTPAMLAAWVFGLLLALIPGIIDWASVWPWAKLAAVMLLTTFHFWLARQRKLIERGACEVTAAQFRWLNEIPTALMVAIVIMVVVRPL